MTAASIYWADIFINMMSFDKFSFCYLRQKLFFAHEVWIYEQLKKA